ncbi:Extracellular sulfatase SULF-1-like protein, partial [Zootermopsis nevadensis]
ASTDDVFASQRRGASAAAEYQTQRRGGKLKKHHIPAQPYEIPKERKPNIILILTDDQDVELGSLNFMPRTLRLLRDGGAEFRHAYVTTPMCCPSRSSLLTGMYVHNHEVFTNNDNCSSAHWQATHETRSFATYLSNAGYRTGYFGKYLNKYNGSYIPPGWREWGGLIMNSRYYNYSINLNGKKIKHGADYHKDYYPDLIANDSVAFLRQSKQYFSRKPVMLVLSFPAPHGPEDSAPQFSHLFFNVTTHHTPTYDYAPNPDKQWILQVTQRMQPIHRQFTDLLMTKRLQTLQSVDDAVEKIFQELKELGELDNTYIIYTSDHGYHLGQFGLVKGKSFPFEFDVRVPFLVRGPEIEPGTIIDDIVLNLDLAPTFLDIAGVEIPVHMDGRSFLKLLHRNPKHGQMSARRKKFKWPDTFLIESSGRRETPESIEAKLHLLKPQHQAKLNKIAAGSESEENGNGTGISATLGTTFAPLTSQYPNLSMDESGPDLQLDNQVLPVVPSGVVTNKLERIALECQSPEYQAPCKPGQKWQCITEGSRWRKHKCKFQGTIYPRGGSNGRKKCACFTPSGFFYTRLEPNERRMQRQFLSAENMIQLAGCLVTPTRNVNCSAAVYKDLPTWRTSKNNIDGAIRKLLAQVEALKEIRRHLRQKRPLDTTSYDASLEDADEDGNDGTEELLEEEKEEEKEEEVDVDDKEGIENSNITNIRKVQHNQEIGVETVTETKNIEEEMRHFENQTKHSQDQHNRNDHKGNHHRGKKKAKEHATVTVSTEENVTQNTPELNYQNQLQTMKTSRIDVTVYHPQRPGYGIQNVNNINSSTSSGNSNKQIFLPEGQGQHTCYCEPDILSRHEEKEIAKEARRRIKEERLKKKERKLKKKAKLEKECLAEKMNCFNHDNDHWKTAPLWTEGPFCFCMNANNNTYSCLRTINATHNFLYCEFVTGLVTFYNLRIDPFEQWNRVHALTDGERSYLRDQLAQLKACRGTKQCTVGIAASSADQ